jgi:hypothetical protein
MAAETNVQAERSALMKEIAQIEQWWRDPRWKGTTRTYSGAFVGLIRHVDDMHFRRLTFVTLTTTFTLTNSR